MKRTCDGCKAFGAISSNRCGLGYKIAPVYISYIVVSGKPLEECPKPKTINNFFELKNKGKEIKK